MSSRTIRRVSLVGAGRVGMALAVRLHECGCEIVSVTSRTSSSARRCAQLVRCARWSNNPAMVVPADLVLLAVPDEQIRNVAHILAEQKHLSFASSVVVHTSGALTSDELNPLRHRAVGVASLHPLQSFPQNRSIRNQVQALEGITYSYEGPRSIMAPMRRLVHNLGGRFIVVPKEEKILYHIACVLASNSVVALLGVAESVFPIASARRARVHLSRLVESSVANALHTSPAEALTGPIVRGDVEVIERHLRELRKRRKEFLLLYRVLGVQALRLARERLPRRVANRIQKLLTGADAG